ncbi:Hypothetical predicted protein [Paramuricea clavata]|uniref:Uncharacterized protein n=1 Tax=Paramuricea clavata TaxID=317549 RepID=A0A6S7IZG2_PARCT|nr:Hypothetical predicted protein [Paramuricea clavata]
MARDIPFRRPLWLPQEIVIPPRLQTCDRVSRYCTDTYKAKRRAIGLKLNARIVHEKKTTSDLKKNDILVGDIVASTILVGGGAALGAAGGAALGGAAALGAEKGAEVGLVGGGPLGAGIGLVAGAVGGIFIFWVGKKMFKPKEEEHTIQIDRYTRKPAKTVGDPSPLNLRDQVTEREIEINAAINPIHALGEDAKQWYYLARLGRYCWIERGQVDDPAQHRLAAECAYDIATACHMNLGVFQWP